MGSRVLSLWLPYLATDRIRQNRHETSSETSNVEGPHATFAKVNGYYQLTALCRLAERAHLKPGMKLDEARARVQQLTLFPRDLKSEQSFLETIRAWCERYTPWVATDRSHERCKGASLWLDIGSATHLYGGEVNLLTDLLGRLRDQGLHAEAAIADHPGAAWAMARFGPADLRIMPVSGGREVLAPLPIKALRLDDEQVLTLEKAGMDRIEHLYRQPRKALQARFGKPLVTRLDQALGLIDEPTSPNAPLPAQQAQLIFADPILTRDALRPSIKRLMRQLAVGLEAAGLGVRRLTLALYRVDSSTAALSIGSAYPCRNIKQLSRMLTEKIENIDPAPGIERVILDAVEIEPLLPESIVWRGFGTAADTIVRDLAHDTRSRCRQRDRPDMHAATALKLDADARHGKPNRQQLAFGNVATALDLAPAPIETAPDQQRSKPLRLLRQPEPIEAVAPLPDDPPILFRWRQGLHKIVRAQGPERIAPDWWRIPAQEQPSLGHDFKSRLDQERRTRDYFAVEDSQGERFWLFREGIYRSSQTTLPRWYLHGLFS